MKALQKQEEETSDKASSISALEEKSMFTGILLLKL